MTPIDRKLIFDFSQLQLSLDDFTSKYSGNISDKTKHILELLNQSYIDKSSDDLNHTIYLARRLGVIDNNLTEVLAKILPEDWHETHEEVVGYFQDFKNPISINSLYETALKNYEYLNYDEFFGLARKCTWALYTIDTPEAKEKLKLLASCDNELIRDYAQKRLVN